MMNVKTQFESRTNIIMIKLDQIKSKVHNKYHNHTQTTSNQQQNSKFAKGFNEYPNGTDGIKIMRKAKKNKKNKKNINNANDELRDMIMVKVHITLEKKLITI